MSQDSPFVEFSAGSTILRQGEPARAMFIIEAGRVEIRRGQAALAELGPGDIFGETAILAEQPVSADAVAKTAVRALAVDPAEFHALLSESAEVAMALMRRLVARMGQTQQRQAAAAKPGAGTSAAAPAPAPAEQPKAAAAAPPPAAAAPPPAAEAPKPAPEAKPAARPAAPPPAAKPGPPPAEPTEKPAAAAAPAGGIVLRHAQGEFRLGEGKDEWLVGRPDPATGQVPDVDLGPLDVARSLSRRHARFKRAEGKLWLVEEPNVANGTWVNGNRLAGGQPVALKPGDKLRFGAIEVELTSA